MIHDINKSISENFFLYNARICT